MADFEKNFIFSRDQDLYKNKNNATKHYKLLLLLSYILLKNLVL